MADDDFTIKMTTIPADLERRLRQYPRQRDKVMSEFIDRAFVKAAEVVPPYPSPPAGSTYRRTGTLGRSLVSTTSPGHIRKKEKIGPGTYRGEIGTNLVYAKYVIGENQAWMHKGRWWNVVTWGKRAEKAIKGLFEKVARELAQFIEGQG